MSRVLFVLESPQSVIAECIRNRGYTVSDLWISHRFGRVRRRHLGSRLPGGHLWLDATALDGSETVVIFDRPDMFNIARWVRRVDSRIRIILWCWNIMPESRIPQDSADFEVVTFDPVDATRFNFRCESTFYFRELQQYASPEIDHDLIFVGRDKGRHDLIESTASRVMKDGGRVHINIVDAGMYIPYREVLTLTARSRAVLDIVQGSQRGLTLRAMEALFLGLHLVTTNPGVLDDPNYPQENVVPAMGDQKQLLVRLAVAPKPAPASALAFYDFEAWLERLLDG